MANRREQDSLASQDERISRRNMLGGLAVAPLAGGLALTAGSAIASEPDPIFAAIKAWREAREAHDAAITVVDAIQSTMWALGWRSRPNVHVGPLAALGDPTGFAADFPVYVERPDQLDKCCRRKAEEIGKLYAEDEAERTRLLGELSRMRDELHAGLASYPVRYQAECDRRGLKAAEEAQDEAGDRSEAALEVVCATVPTTGAGLLALIEALVAEDEPDAVVLALGTIAEAAAQLLGAVAERPAMPALPAVNVEPGPIAEAMLDSYDAWLFHERRWLHVHRWGLDASRKAERFVRLDNIGARFHRPGAYAATADRAATILTMLGCDWEADYRRRQAIDGTAR